MCRSHVARVQVTCSPCAGPPVSSLALGQTKIAYCTELSTDCMTLTSQGRSISEALYLFLIVGKCYKLTILHLSYRLSLLPSYVALTAYPMPQLPITLC